MVKPSAPDAVVFKAVLKDMSGREKTIFPMSLRVSGLLECGVGKVNCYLKPAALSRELVRGKFRNSTS